MTGVIEQTVMFQGGVLDGKCAKVRFRLPFEFGAKVDTGMGMYAVRSGPIAECIVKAQEAIENGCLVLVPDEVN